MNCLESEIGNFDWRQRVVARLLCRENAEDHFDRILNNPMYTDLIKANWELLCGLNYEFILLFIRKFPQFFNNCLVWIPALKKWPQYDLIYKLLYHGMFGGATIPDNWREFVVYFIREGFRNQMNPLENITFPKYLVVFLRQVECLDKFLMQQNKWRRCFRSKFTFHDFLPNMSLEQRDYANRFLTQLALETDKESDDTWLKLRAKKREKWGNWGYTNDDEYISDGYSTPSPSLEPTRKKPIPFVGDTYIREREVPLIPRFNPRVHESYEVFDYGQNLSEMNPPDEHFPPNARHRRMDQLERYYEQHPEHRLAPPARQDGDAIIEDRMNEIEREVNGE